MSCEISQSGRHLLQTPMTFSVRSLVSCWRLNLFLPKGHEINLLPGTLSAFFYYLTFRFTVTTFLDEMAWPKPLLILGSGQAMNRLCLEKQIARDSALLIRGLLCAESIDTEKLNEDPHTKAEGWDLTLCLGYLQKSWQCGLLCKEIEHFLCTESSDCLTDAPGSSFWRIRKFCSPWEGKCAVSPRGSLGTNVPAEYFHSHGFGHQGTNKIIRRCFSQNIVMVISVQIASCYHSV